MSKVAVIGVGNIGQHHARVYSKLKNCQLAAVCDPDPAKGKKIAKAHSVKFYQHYVNMLDNESIDAISIAVPTNLHKEVALECIRRGVHVLVEKPIAASVADAEKMLEASRKHNVKLAVGHVERFNPGIIAMKKLIGRGKLGKIISILSRRVGLSPPQVNGTNVIIDLAVHDIDICNYLLGETPVSVSALGGKAVTRYNEDYAELLLGYKKSNAIIQVNWITPVKVRILNITGIKGYAELNYITQKLVLYQNRYKLRTDSFGEFIREMGEPQKNEIKFTFKEPLVEELKDFLASIDENRKPAVDGMHGLNVLKTAIAATSALRSKKNA